MVEVVKNAENDIFSLVSPCLMSVFSPNVGHQYKIMSKSLTSIIQLNSFNKNHPVAAFWISIKTGRPKSWLDVRGSLLLSMNLIIGKDMEICRLLTHIPSFVSKELTRPYTSETDPALLNEVMNKGNNVCYKPVIFRWNVQGFPIGFWNSTY